MNKIFQDSNPLIINNEKQPLSEAHQAEFERAFLALAISPEWRVRLVGQRVPSNEASYKGSCVYNARYRNAEIVVSTATEIPDRRENAVHESLHIAMADLDALIDVILHQLSDEQARPLREIYDNESEAFIQQLARGLAGVLW